MDIGTNSVGMACTDEEYNLLRAKGNMLWSVRLFDEAHTAAERRAFRTSRRRLARRRQRVALLQGLFAPFMTDTTFFIRLNNSGFDVEDKDSRLTTRFSLFADSAYTDKDFHREYPTIFHLRNALMQERKDGDAPKDIRLYYLALHHILKYRGHFLFEGEGDGVGKPASAFEAYRAVVDEIDGRLSIDEELEKFITELAMDSTKGLNAKKKEINAKIEDKESCLNGMAHLLVGESVLPKAIFGDSEEKWDKVKELQFKGLSDEDFEGRREDFSDEQFEILSLARSIYSSFVLSKTLEGSSTVSEAMIKIYDAHKEDLRDLKRLVGNDRDAYNRIFRSISKDKKKDNKNYVRYIGCVRSGGKKISVKKCKQEDFYKFLTTELNNLKSKDEELYQKIIKKIGDNNFLPKILYADGGRFPHQVNGKELNVILDRLCADYPVFVEKDESGLSVSDKIRKIFEFRIPYYVGPLNKNENATHSNAWFVRKEKGKIFPWNFDEKVDRAKSGENFIKRMTNKCTYLHGEDVLPKGSMYYQAYDVLNQLNKITLDGAPLSVELKQEIFNNVYKKNKKVSVKTIKDYFVANGKYTKEEAKALTIAGFNTEVGLKANMNSYVTFHEMFGDLVDREPDMFENIILWHTVHTDKNLVEESIKAKYGDKFSDEGIKKIKGLTSFKEFGRLSKELLTGLVGGAEEGTGEVYTVLERLYNTNDNFMEIIFSDRYQFQTEIEEKNGLGSQEIEYSDVEKLYISPAVRRGVWQAIRMTKEYVEAVGRKPDKIFIEVTRHDGEKKQTSSRKKQLETLYEQLGQDCEDIKTLTAELNRRSESDLNSKRLYLYFLQLGRCIYTGEPIRLEDIGGDTYDVDHIVPQSLVKDDSIDNLVLVKRERNKTKDDNYPLPQGFTNQQDFWKLLRRENLMSAKKYANLTRTKPLDENDFRDFENRQLVFTNQTVKAVAELLKRMYPETEIVYSKAGNVNDFKQKNNIVKCRETNDLHHARDAYLNIVVGNVYSEKFQSARSYYRKDENGFWKRYNLEHIFDDLDITKIKKTVFGTSMSVTNYSYTNQGEFYDQTVYRKDEETIDAPRKGKDPYLDTKKYGGYKSLTTAYFAVVESNGKKGKRMRTLEAIPVLVDYRSKHDPNAVVEYLSKSKLLIEPKIIVPKLRIKTLVSVNGFKGLLAGKTGDRIVLHNANQWFSDQETDLYVKNLVKLGKREGVDQEAESFKMVKSTKGETLTIDRAQNERLYGQLLAQLKKPIYQAGRSAKSFSEKIEEKFDAFRHLTVFNQAKVLVEIVKFLKCNAECANLSLLNDDPEKDKTCGKIRISKDITDVDFVIIHRSPCGLTERKQWIKRM